MSLILDEIDKLKLSCLLGEEYAKNNPAVVAGVLNTHAYRLQFMDSLDIQSTMLDKYRKRLHDRGAVQDAKALSEFTRLTLACNIKKKTPYHLE